MTFKARGLYASSSKEPRRFRLGPWLVLGAVLVLALVVTTVAAVLGTMDVDRGTSSDSFDAPQAVRIDNRTGGDVTLTGTGQDQVQVERALRGSPLSEPTEETHQSAQDLHLEATCANVLLLSLFGGCAIDYDILVPEGTAVTVETISGPIHVENVDGELDLSSVSGRVLVSGNDGDTTVETVSGQITLEQVRGTADLESTSGDITAQGEGEDIEVVSTSGKVDVSGFDARTVVAESISGSVRVGGGFTDAEISTVSGSIEVSAQEPFTLLSVESISGNITAQVPQGDYHITGDSTSGGRDLRVDTSAKADSRIDADTVSGSLTVTYH